MIITKTGKPNYLTQAKKLSRIETGCLLSRMAKNIERKLEKDKISQLEAMAIQLELENEQLDEWRKVVQNVTIKEAEYEAKKKGKAKAIVMYKVLAKPKAPIMGKVGPGKLQETAAE